MNENHKQEIPLAVIAVLLIVMFASVFVMLEKKWAEGNSYYSHGYLIPAVTIFLVWRMREQLARIKQEPSNLGLIVLAFGLLMRLAGAYRQVNFVNGFSLIFVLLGLVLYLYGRRITTKLLFPILFLAAMIPLPDVAIIDISFELQRFATEISTRVIPLFGIVMRREANTVSFWRPSVGAVEELTIADVCSGLRSMIALLAFGAVFAYLAKVSFRRRLEMFAASIPCSVIANMCRIVLITIIAYFWGAEFATNDPFLRNPLGGDPYTVHDLTGILIYIVAFVGFFSYDKLLNRPPFRLPRRNGQKVWMLDYDGRLIKLAENQLENLIASGHLRPDDQLRPLNGSLWQSASELPQYEKSPRHRKLKHERTGQVHTFDECIEMAQSGELRRDDFLSYAGGSEQMLAETLDFLRPHWRATPLAFVMSILLYIALPVALIVVVRTVPTLRVLSGKMLGSLLLAVVFWFGVRTPLLLGSIVSRWMEVPESPMPCAASEAGSTEAEL